MKFNKQDVNRLRPQLEKALEAFAKEHGVRVKVGHATYGDTNIDFHVDLAMTNADGTVETAELTDWKKWCNVYGFKITDLDRTFNYKGDDYVITGLKMSRRRMPVVTNRVVDGKLYYFATDLVREALKKEDDAAPATA